MSWRLVSSVLVGLAAAVATVAMGVAAENCAGALVVRAWPPGWACVEVVP